MNIKEPKDIETSVSGPAGSEDAHFVLIPQPSNHSRDPLVCAAPDWMVKQN